MTRVRFNRNFKRGFSKPKTFGRLRNQKSTSRIQGGKFQSQLKGADVNIFINKSTQDNFSEYQPDNSFDNFNLKSPLRANIINKGYTLPTQIQDKAIGPILAGKDLIGLAQTGTGKTAAFLIPIINNIFVDRNKHALIIAPTRELAVQINEDFKELARGMHMHSALIIGGTNIGRQIHELRRDPQVVIGTPGRLRELVELKKLYLEDFSIFVLDEVDLMVDIGFLADIKYFISLLPKIRQSLFFSATISPKIHSFLLQNFVKNPISVSIKKRETSENVDQDIIKVVSREKKVDQLHNLLTQDGFDKVLIFGRTKHEVEKLYKALTLRGFKAGAIHGNKKQSQRQRALQNFKQNEIQILLATDVASRGLDIDNVTHVINYDLPQTYDDYIHRIGRTGRAGKIGTALTFIE
ncbi:DEAD/DEAH box helicase [Candidatus Daviesbacteria bacterium]|nr:DEAD/DEAH box helicase [Candidatus Daviesbacteria bacterium]